MGGLRKKLALTFGLAILAFVIANVHFGMIANTYIDGAGYSKLKVMKMAEPYCAFDQIESEIQTSGDSYCLAPVGQWDGADLLMLFEGLVLVGSGGFKLPQNTKWGQRIRKVSFVVGSVLCLIAVLDRLEMLPSSHNSEGLAELMPFDIAPWLLQIAIATLGAFMIRGPKYLESEALHSKKKKLKQRREVANKFRDTFGTSRHAPASNSGGSSSILLQRSSNPPRSRKSGLNVLATCPYCRGGGCKKCNNKGVL